MRIKNCILFVFGSLLLSFSAKADVTAIRLRFGSDGTLTDLGTSLSSASMALSAPIVETDGTITDPVVAAVATEGETDALFLEPEDNSTNTTADADDDQGVPMMLTASEESGGLRGAENDPPADSDPPADNPCEAGYQPRPDGQCMACPENGTITEIDDSQNLYYCCGKFDEDLTKDKAGYRWQYDSWVYNNSCGCPEHGTISEEYDEDCCKNGYAWNKAIGSYSDVVPDACGCPEGGKLSQGECCKDGYAWNKTSYSAVNVPACGCPSGYKIDSAKTICCSETELGTFLGMTTSTADKDKAIQECGCQTGETRVKSADITNGYVCCGSDKKIKRSTSNMGDLTDKDAKYCGCDTGEYSESKGCVPCLTDAFCLEKGLGHACLKNADISQQKCVECTISQHCSEQPSGCSNPNACCPASTTEKVCDTETNTCKTCAQMTNNARPVRWHGLVDVNSCNSCYECTNDSHCASRTDGKKICDPNTLKCEVCILDTEAQNQNHGCEDAQTEALGADNKKYPAPYCVPKDKNGTRHCSECRYNSDCPSADRSNCLEAQGICSMECGDVGFDPETGECKCSGSTPVFNIYTKKCVKCYDSISGAWTDLGCNAEPDKTNYPAGSPWNYSPWQAPKTNNKPVCWEDGGTNKVGQCVECTENGHCPGEKICDKNNHTCGCPSDTEWVESSGKCMVCTAHYGSTSTGKKCTTSAKPYCSSSGCTCKEPYKSDKKDGDGKCPINRPGCKDGECQCLGNYDKTNKEEGNGLCPENRPKCDNKVCKCTGNWKDNQSNVGDCVEGMPVCDNGVCKECGDGLEYKLSEEKCVAKNCPSGQVLSDGKCICPKGRWLHGTVCRACPPGGSCTTVDDTSPCPNDKYLLTDTKNNTYSCVACLEHAHCVAGKYCDSNTCKKCTEGYDCGCGSFKCANGDGGCFTQIGWCKKKLGNTFDQAPTANSACSGYVCCSNANNTWTGKTPDTCAACASGKACR